MENIIESDNSDSEIPERFAELVKEEINKLYKEKKLILMTSSKKQMKIRMNIKQLQLKIMH